MIRFGFCVWVGYSMFMQAAPYIQAKIESWDLDKKWQDSLDVW